MLFFSSNGLITKSVGDNGQVEVAKTGLGSSAALTTSLVGGLLKWFGVVNLVDGADSEERRIIHNLSQLVHANAQGKIGSGFDVAAAVYGEFGSSFSFLFSI